jgi:hypothetical protein
MPDRVMDQWLAKINKLTSWQAAIIIAAVGFAVFFTGLANPFMGDDFGQIVNDVPVHSITHIAVLFDGGTFYNGQGLAPLSGVYYRPLMMTVFSLLYTLFGAHAIAFHAFQILLCIASSILLFLVFSYTFAPSLALCLSLIFLVHPINAQVVFAIPTMQDALFFLFGILAIWLLLRCKSIRSLYLVAFCLLLSLLSKETGILFVVMAMLYLFWFERRQRLYAFIATMLLPIVLWLVLKIHAVGLSSHSTIAPIDKLNLVGRLLTAPSILLFYMTKFVFPWRLASAYYWVYPTFSFQHVLLPLLVDFAVIAVFAYLGYVVHKQTSKAMFVTYLSFSIWTVIGLLLHSQIEPLDFTASDAWSYFPMAGVLGMIGVILATLQSYIRPNWLYLTAVLVIGILGLRTAYRGTDWKDAYTLASQDLAASKEQFHADTALANYYFNRDDYTEAKVYATKSVSIYPTAVNNNTLGGALLALGDYPHAYVAFNNGLKYLQLSPLYDNLAELTMVYGNPKTNEQSLMKGVNAFPQDGAIWLYLALQLYRNGDVADARTAITKAAMYGHAPQSIYDGIMNNKSFTIDFTISKNITQRIALP